MTAVSPPSLGAPAAALALLVCVSAYAQSPRRFAVIVGNDEGGEGTRPLLYAREDARKFSDLLLRLGGVRPEDAELVLNGSAAEFLAALSRAERKAQEGRGAGHTVLIVYYSGHAKDGALRLGDTQIPFDALKDRLSRAPADVRIGIFDACRSGMITRSKGARHAPEFEIQTDVGRSAQGMVLLTSSASDEDSQESDQLHGSYFSHHLVSGLLGDADRSGDGRVTLSEAYAYAYDRTVADTADSAAGAQHPTFSYDLAGNGDFVLTEISRSEGIGFPLNAPEGVYYVVDRSGFVVAEVVKPPDQQRVISVAPGSYTLKRRLSDRLRIGDVEVGSGQLTWVDEARLKDAPFSEDPVKGVSLVTTSYGLGLSGTYQAFFEAPTRETLFPSAAMLGAELQLRGFFRRDWVWDFDIATGGASGVVVLPELSEPFHFTEVTAGTSVWVEWPVGSWVPFVGARLALLLMSRQFTDPSQAGLTQGFATWSPGLVAGVRYRLSRHWDLEARARAHYVLYNVDESRSLGYWDLGALVNYAF